MQIHRYALLPALGFTLCACDGNADSRPVHDAAAHVSLASAAQTEITPLVKEIRDTSYLTRASAEEFVRDYYAALAQHDYARAYGFWSGDGKASTQDFAHFRDGYVNNIDWLDAKVGSATPIEGAAGSRYTQVPVQVQERMKDGSAHAVEGRFTLRAVVIDGADEKARHWHFTSADFTRLPDAADKKAAAAQ